MEAGGLKPDFGELERKPRLLVVEDDAVRYRGAEALKGDTWLSVASVPYLNVRNRKLLDESFYNTLRDALT